MDNLLEGRCRALRAPGASIVAAAALLTGAATAPAAHGAGLAAASATCPGAETPIAAGTVEDSRSALRCLIGAVRAERGLGPLAPDGRLAHAAQVHASDMVGRGYFAHRSPGGSDVGDRLARAGWKPASGSWWAGEILVAGSGPSSTPRRLVAAWLQSPPHRAVLLSARPDAIGIGVRRNTPDRRHAGTGVTVDAVLGRRCAPGDPLSGYETPSDPLSGYETEDQDPCG